MGWLAVARADHRLDEGNVRGLRWLYRYINMWEVPDDELEVFKVTTGDAVFVALVACKGSCRRELLRMEQVAPFKGFKGGLFSGRRVVYKSYL